MTASGRIALIFDCDGTIAEDTSTRLLTELGIPDKAFWRKSNALERAGWDPPLSYMHLLIEHSRNGTPITKRRLERAGKAIEFSEGIPSFFGQIRRYVEKRHARRGISLGIYVVSSGFEDVLRASKLAPLVDDIFACRFAYDEKTGGIIAPRRAVTYTDKTRYLFAISKGLSSGELDADPYRVNDFVPAADREVPLRNMIYIGDGPTDVACMSLLKHEGAEIFAVYTSPRRGIPERTYTLARTGRFTRGPFKREYTPDSDLRRALESEIDGYVERLVSERSARRIGAARH